MNQMVKYICILLFPSLLLACSDDSDNRSGASVKPVQGNGPTTVIDDAAESVSDNIVETAVNAGTFTSLVAALQASGLDEVLADESKTFTVFAPTDEAFDSLGDEALSALLADTDALQGILLYHVISGQSVDAQTAISLAGTTVEMANGESISLTMMDGNLLIDSSIVIATDIQTSNGIIHVIDAVLLPPTSEPEIMANIVDTAVAAGSFTTLVAALQAAGLDETLADESQTFTVFAPTDAAFEKLGSDTIAALLADTDTLSNILLYHVIGGASVEAQAAIGLAGSEVDMANGETVSLSLQDGNLLIDDATVISTDIMTSNGIIHVIDTVLTP